MCMCLLSGFLDTAQSLCMLPLIIGVKGLCALHPDSPDSWNLWGQQLKITSQSSHSEQAIFLVYVCVCLYLYCFPTCHVDRKMIYLILFICYDYLFVLIFIWE